MRSNLKKMAVGIVASGMLVGCLNNNPSKSDVETAVNQLWASYSWEFSSNFDVDSYKRLNGWADGEDYWVEVAYQVKAKENYYEMVADCVEPTAARYVETPMGQLSMGLSAMMKSVQGTEALKEYSEYKKNNPEPEKMRELRAKYKEENINTSFLDCVNHFSEKSDIFHKNLKKGDLSDFSIKLRFKKTEQGWKNI